MWHGRRELSRLQILAADNDLGLFEKCVVLAEGLAQTQEAHWRVGELLATAADGQPLPGEGEWLAAEDLLAEIGRPVERRQRLLVSAGAVRLRGELRLAAVDVAGAVGALADAEVVFFVVFFHSHAVCVAPSVSRYAEKLADAVVFVPVKVEFAGKDAHFHLEPGRR